MAHAPDDIARLHSGTFDTLDLPRLPPASGSGPFAGSTTTFGGASVPASPSRAACNTPCSTAARLSCGVGRCTVTVG
jgi:hypothetical protein